MDVEQEEVGSRPLGGNRPGWRWQRQLPNSNLTNQKHLIAISIFFSYRCEMATKDRARKFAAQAILVDNVLVAQGVSGNPGRVVFILDAANKTGGETQKQILEATSLPKDVVSKLVGSLVSARLLTRERASENSRIKRLNTTASGRKLLSLVTAALQPFPRKLDFGPVRKVERLSLF